MLRNSRGNAIIEIVPVLAIFILIVNFALGFFGLIHSGIMASIGARNYAFRTFTNRADLTYFYDRTTDFSFTYKENGLRFHASVSEVSNSKWVPTRRPIQFSEIRGVAEEKGAKDRLKIKNIQEGKKASEVGIDEGINLVQIKTMYGICLNWNCGG